MVKGNSTHTVGAVASCSQTGRLCLPYHKPLMMGKYQIESLVAIKYQCFSSKTQISIKLQIFFCLKSKKICKLRLCPLCTVQYKSLWANIWTNICFKFYLMVLRANFQFNIRFWPRPSRQVVTIRLRMIKDDQPCSRLEDSPPGCISGTYESE